MNFGKTLFTFSFCLLLLGSLGCGETNYELADYQGLDGLGIGNGLTFHPSEKLILISKPSEELDARGNAFYRIFLCKDVMGKWSCDVQVPFSGDFTDYHPVFSPDGKWLYFNSDRPVPNTMKRTKTINIWRVSFDGEQWGTPEYLEMINTENHESYPSVAKSGALYFNSDRPGGYGSMDIYKSELKDGTFTEPVALATLNTPDSENDLFVDPEERFMVLNRYFLESREIELFLSVRDEEGWSIPRPMEEINRRNIWELTPVLSPDGKFLFYEINGKIHRTETPIR